jgi:CheY-like chemotaxis protein
MDRATQERIFEPFFTTKPAGHGTGLGLAAAYGILKQNDGYIAVASRLGEGASFSLYLPLGIGEPPAERPATPLPAVHGEGRDEATVLVVEDEAGVRAMAVRTLELGGFRVLQAADGASALAMVERHGPPDVVLTDLVMPGISGADLARRLGQRWPALPILFMSGYSVESLRQQGTIGVEAITIQKPFSPETLLDSVTAALYHASAGNRTR